LVDIHSFLKHLYTKGDCNTFYLFHDEPFFVFSVHGFVKEHSYKGKVRNNTFVTPVTFKTMFSYSYFIREERRFLIPSLANFLPSFA